MLAAVAGDAVGRRELIHAGAVETVAPCLGGIRILLSKRYASGSERERHCARILRKFRENTVAPYATLPYARASKAHRPTKQNLQHLQNLLDKTY